MWIMTPDAVVGLGWDPENLDRLVVQAPKAADIGRMFGAVVVHDLGPGAPFRYTARVARPRVAAILAAEVGYIDYADVAAVAPDANRRAAYDAARRALGRVAAGGSVVTGVGPVRGRP